MHGGGGQLRSRSLNLGSRGLSNAILRETPASLVLQPVVLIVEGVAWEVEKTDGVAEVVVELVPVDVEASHVQGTEAAAERLIGGLIPAERWDGEGSRPKSCLDHAGADGVRAD